MVASFRRGSEPPITALQDHEATIERFHPSYFRVDWRLFDPAELAWRFDGGSYVDASPPLKPPRPPDPLRQH